MSERDAPAVPPRAEAAAEAIEHEVADTFLAKGRSPHSPEARREAAGRAG